MQARNDEIPSEQQSKKMRARERQQIKTNEEPGNH